MIIRALDSDGDFVFGHGKQDYFTDNAAIAENIRTRLLSFFGDCFFDLEAGVDWFSLLGYPATVEEIQLSCRAVIANSAGVVNVNDVSVVQNRDERTAFVNYNVDTIFSANYNGGVEVTNA